MEPSEEIPPLYFKEQISGSRGRPFDWVTLVDGGIHGSMQDASIAAENLADVVFVDSQTVKSVLLAEERSAASNDHMGWLRSACALPLELSVELDQQTLTRSCVERVLTQARDFMAGPRIETESGKAVRSDRSSPTAVGEVPLTPEAAKEISQRMLRELLFDDFGDGLKQITTSEKGSAALENWSRRLCQDEDLVAEQLLTDIEAWKSSISSIIKVRMCNWRQIEQIQLNALEGITAFIDSQVEALVEVFAPFSDVLGSPQEIHAAAVSYLQKLSENCLQLLDHFRTEGEALGRKYGGWCAAISIESEREENEWDTSQLSSEMQALVRQITTALESTVHREIVGILDDGLESLNLSKYNAGVRSSVSLRLKNIFAQTSELVAKLSAEMGIELNADNSADNREFSRSLPLEDVPSFIPALAQHGGKILRIAIVPEEQAAVCVEISG